MTTQNIAVLLEKLKQNHELTQQIRADVKEGFKALDVRTTQNTENIRELQWQRKNDEKSTDETIPAVGSNKWLLATLVTIILALIAAVGTM